MLRSSSVKRRQFSGGVLASLHNYDKDQGVNGQVVWVTSARMEKPSGQPKLLARSSPYTLSLEERLREACATFRSASANHQATQAPPSSNGNLVASALQLGPSLRTGLRM